MELQEKKDEKDQKSKGIIFQAKDSRVIKAVDTAILILSRNDDRKSKQVITITSGPITIIRK